MRGALVMLAGLLVASALSWLWPRLEAPPDRAQIGRQLLAEGRADEAILLFEVPLWRGIAEYKAGRFDRAIGEFYPPESLVELYNLGTAFAQLEDWSGATAALQRVLRLDPTHVDARHNLDIVLQLAALDAAQGNEAPPEESPLKDESGTVNKQAGERDDEAREQRASEANDSDARGVDSTPDREGNSNRSGELREVGKTDEAGTSDLSGDPGEQTERSALDRRGAAELELREARQAAELLLRQIYDDPEKVLRVRLYTANQNRKPQAKP